MVEGSASHRGTKLIERDVSGYLRRCLLKTLSPGIEWEAPRGFSRKEVLCEDKYVSHSKREKLANFLSTLKIKDPNDRQLVDEFIRALQWAEHGVQLPILRPAKKKVTYRHALTVLREAIATIYQESLTYRIGKKYRAAEVVSNLCRVSPHTLHCWEQRVKDELGIAFELLLEGLRNARKTRPGEKSASETLTRVLAEMDAEEFRAVFRDLSPEKISGKSLLQIDTILLAIEIRRARENGELDSEDWLP